MSAFSKNAASWWWLPIAGRHNRHNCHERLRTLAWRLCRPCRKLQVCCFSFCCWCRRFTICWNCRAWSDNDFCSDLSTLRSCLHGNDGGAEAEVWDESKEDRGLSQKSCGWADDGDYDDADDDNDDYGEAILELGWSTSSKLIYIVDELMKRW